MPGVTVLSLDNYNDASRLIDGNFDGAGTSQLARFRHACQARPHVETCSFSAAAGTMLRLDGLGGCVHSLNLQHSTPQTLAAAPPTCYCLCPCYDMQTLCLRTRVET